ncbi:hypothetical protein RG47T_4811 [Mucilaginibacter polytrichastri]|uniref:Uncharacterized protein n=1 Tax=Mucilaginibacter polytrichastri TaxID=1302689 RepID=A0A1Q6A5P0_9SPHI|nr:hypothetical protein RG47T_4811 [Mucilaginibacter polytrichastri]SFS74467.1 hypothetical protein SAMN04487890_103278 [Mucilaginibacter polytrichastri]
MQQTENKKTVAVTFHLPSSVFINKAQKAIRIYVFMSWSQYFRQQDVA